MSRWGWAPLVFFALTSFACSRKPCETGMAEDGTPIRLDTALSTCNFTPEPKIRIGGEAFKRSMIYLDGTESIDQNRDDISYQWTIEPPPSSQAVLDDPKAEVATFFADVEGTYQIVLVVSDGELESEPLLETLIVHNREPIANAGPDLSVDLNTELLLDGTASIDPDGDTLRYTWAIVMRPRGSLAQLDNANVDRPRFVGDIRGSYELSLRVNDGTHDSKMDDTLRVTCGQGRPPVANAGADAMIGIGLFAGLDGTGSSDPDGDMLLYRWRVAEKPEGSAVQIRDSSAAATNFFPDRTGSYTIELTVSDGVFDSAADTVQITAEEAPPGPSTFDRTRMYSIATVPGSSGRVYCEVDPPYTTSVGYEDGYWPALPTIRSDGKLITGPDNINGHTIREYVADRLPWDNSIGGYRFPRDLVNNDPIIPTPRCQGDAFRFLMHPATDMIVYNCEASPNDWFDLADNPVQICDHMVVPGLPMETPARLGYDGSMICYRTILDPNGVTHALTMGNQMAVRARPEGGFWVIRNDADPMQDIYERWIILPDGTEMLDVTYGPFPTGYIRAEFDTQDNSAIDASGNLYRWAAVEVDLNADHTLVRWTGPAMGEAIFGVAQNPICTRGDRGRLFTGP